MKPIIDILPSIPRPHEAVPLPALALRAVTAKNNRTVYASSDTLYKGAFFTRDALEAAEDVMTFKPSLAGNILITTASYCGVIESDDNEESVGKMAHECRNIVVDGKKIKGVSLEIFNRLAFKWGGNETEMIYYGAIDVTPHFLRTLHMFCQLHGTKILDTEITSQRDKKVRTMRQIAELAASWLIKNLDSSASGLLEYKRRNPQGILNQVWKDSDEFYVHENGQMANHNAPIASIEVQGLVYDALIAADGLELTNMTASGERALQVRDRTLELLWLPERKYFALGTDYDNEGVLRIIKTATANPAALLDTSFFDKLPAEQRARYTTAIITHIFSKDFLTNVGIRSRSLSQGHLIPFWDYHGSYVSWPKETYDIAKGLKRQGFPKLSTQLENRLLNIVLKTKQYAEFFYVDDHGRILTHAPNAHSYSELFVVESSNKPETIQAWTVSAIYAITTKRTYQKFRPRKNHAQTAAQREIEARILSHIPLIDRHLNPFTLAAKYPTYKYTLRNKSTQ